MATDGSMGVGGHASSAVFVESEDATGSKRKSRLGVIVSSWGEGCCCCCGCCCCSSSSSRVLLSSDATLALAAADIWRDLPLCCVGGGRTYQPPEGGRKEAVSMGGARAEEKDETGTDSEMVKWQMKYKIKNKKRKNTRKHLTIENEMTAAV